MVRRAPRGNAPFALPAAVALKLNAGRLRGHGRLPSPGYEAHRLKGQRYRAACHHAHRFHRHHSSWRARHVILGLRLPTLNYSIAQNPNHFWLGYPYALRCIIRRAIGARQKSGRAQDASEQHRVRFRKPRLDTKENAGRKKQRGNERTDRPCKRQCHPISEDNCRRRRQKGRQSVNPDWSFGPVTGDLGRRDLEPIDAGRLKVASLLLKPDVEIVSFSIICLLAWAYRGCPDRPAESR